MLTDSFIALPAFHPVFSAPCSFISYDSLLLRDTALGIPSDSANHTEGFAKAARTVEAHKAAMLTMKGLTLTAFRVLNDDVFWRKVRLFHERSACHHALRTGRAHTDSHVCT